MKNVELNKLFQLPCSITSTPPSMAQYDLTNALSEFMDLHLVFPLLEFLSTREIYKSNSLMKSKYQLLQVFITSASPSSI